MNLIDKIFSEWEKDCEIDVTNLTGESAGIGKLHQKYLKMMTSAHMKLRSKRAEYKKLVKNKTEYYSGRLDIEEIKELGWEPLDRKVMKNDIGTYLEADDDIIELSLTIGFYEEAVSILESIIRQINNRNFQIKSVVDWERFVSGSG